VETLERAEKAFGLFVPRQGFGISPALRALRDGKCPIKQIANVGENSASSPSRGAAAKFAKAFRRVSDSFATAICHRGYGVAQEFTFRIGHRHSLPYCV